MRRFYLIAVLLVFPVMLFAQAEQTSTLSEKDMGELLFRQRCNVCHSRGWGPRLTKDVMANETFVRNQIMNGGERMPGFKYGLDDSQIKAIMSYLKNMPAMPARRGAEPADD